MFSTNTTINTLTTKEDLVEKLLKENKISFKEALVLMDKVVVQVKEVTKPNPLTTPIKGIKPSQILPYKKIQPFQQWLGDQVICGSGIGKSVGETSYPVNYKVKQDGNTVIFYPETASTSWGFVQSSVNKNTD